MDIFIAFAFSWISTVSGVALGGWLVYRTKREGYDGLFSPPETGDAFNLTDTDDDEDTPVTSTATIPRPVSKANDAFVQQFAETLADKAAS